MGVATEKVVSNPLNDPKVLMNSIQRIASRTTSIEKNTMALFDWPLYSCPSPRQKKERRKAKMGLLFFILSSDSFEGGNGASSSTS
jgi:hypothetical protein